MTKGHNVRLTPEAHQLLAEKAVDYNVPMKEIASEAIFLLVKSDSKDKECLANLKRLEKKNQDNKRYAFGTFILGAVVSGCVMFFVGVLWCGS